MHFLQYKIIGAHKKFRKWPRPLFMPKTNHTCHQKSNQSGETVPLIMLSACTLSRFPCFLMVSRVGWGISSGSCPYFPLAGGLCKFYANAGGTQPIQHQLLLVQNKQQANPLLTIHNYTPLVISSKDISS